MLNMTQKKHIYTCWSFNERERCVKGAEIIIYSYIFFAYNQISKAKIKRFPFNALRGWGCSDSFIQWRKTSKQHLVICSGELPTLNLCQH